MIIHSKIQFKPILIENFKYILQKFILIITEINVEIFDLKLNQVCFFPLKSIKPVSTIFKKEDLLLFIYDKNNSFVKLDLKSLGNINSNN